jgi:hypothetical protein
MEGERDYLNRGIIIKKAKDNDIIEIMYNTMQNCSVGLHMWRLKK